MQVMPRTGRLYGIHDLTDPENNLKAGTSHLKRLQRIYSDQNMSQMEMIKFTLAGLKEIGFNETQIYTTLELRMKCGIGKCGRCNIGSKYVCKDGPVFHCDELDEIPAEY